MNKRHTFLLALSVSLLTAVIYLPALKNDFILWDDDLYIIENYHIHQFDWSMIKWAFSEFFWGLWQPLTSISLAFDYAVWGLNPVGYHLTNIILHAANTFLAVIICVLLLERNDEVLVTETAGILRINNRIYLAAGVMGLLFGIHPLHVESVAWATERKDVLYGFFYLLSGYFYLVYLVRQGNDHDYSPWFRNKAYLCSLLFFVLSLLSKSMAVTLPVVMLVIEWYPLKRITSIKTLFKSCNEKIPFFIFVVISAIITLTAISPEQRIENLPLDQRPLIAAKAAMTYLWKTLAPIELLPYYPYPPRHEISFSSISVLLSVTMVIALSVCAVLGVFCSDERFGGRFKGLCSSAIMTMGWQSAWLCYIVMLFPVSGIFDNGGTHSMAHRYFYLPSLGPFCLIGAVAARIWQRSHGQFLRTCCIVVALGLTVSLSWLTYRQILIWRSSIVFWSYVISRSPVPIPMAYNNRGLAYKESGEMEKSLADLNRLTELSPDSYQSYNNRGSVLIEKGDLDGAIRDFNRALALKPDDDGAYVNRGIALRGKGEFDSALRDFRHAITLNPDNYIAHNNVGLVLLSKGVHDQAIDAFNQAIAKRPLGSLAYCNLGLVIMEKKDLDGAVKLFRRALTLNQNDANAYVCLGTALRKKGDMEGALLNINRAIDLNPSDSSAYNNRGMLLKEKGDLNGALQDFSRAISFGKDQVAGYVNRGAAYRELGKLEMALADLNAAIELNPANDVALNNRGLVWKSGGKFERAIMDYNRAIALRPDNADAYTNRGVVYEMVGRLDDAIGDYDRAIAINPGLVSTFNNRGLALRKKGLLNRAVADFDAAVSLNPALYLTRLNRAMTFKELGNYDLALQDYNEVLALKPDLAIAYAGRAAIYGRLNRPAQALGDYEKACSLGDREGCKALQRTKP